MPTQAPLREPLITVTGYRPPRDRRHGGPSPRLLRRARLAALAVGGFLVPWCVVLSATLPRTAQAHHWSLAWTGLDGAEAIAALATAALLARDDSRACLTAAAGGALLLTDAWFDVCTSAPGLGAHHGRHRGGPGRAAPRRRGGLARGQAVPQDPVSRSTGYPSTVSGTGQLSTGQPSTGGMTRPCPVAASKACATWSSGHSARRRPTSWSPTGRPSGVNPAGTEMAGSPVTEIR